jgi:hypothetical protein
MTGIDAIIADNEAATAELLEAAGRAGSVWNAPPAPAGWSPAQVVEHVSLTLEQGAAVVSGQPSKFPSFPALLRPLARTLYYNRVLRKGAFPPSRTTAALEPSLGAATPDEGALRLKAAARLFNQACRERAARSHDIIHPVFGTVSVESYARFQVLHTRHHRAQLARHN